MLVNEFDYVGGGDAAELLVDLLAQPQDVLALGDPAPAGIYRSHFVRSSTTGIASGFDLDNNGSAVTTLLAPGYGDDAFRFGAFPGQFGLLVLSRYPIATDDVRTFQGVPRKGPGRRALARRPGRGRAG